MKSIRVSQFFIALALFMSVFWGITILVPVQSFAADTGLISPTRNSDPDHTWSKDAKIRANGNNYARSTGNGHRIAARRYNFPTFPAGAIITGIEVRLDWWLNSTQGNNSLEVYLSWNNNSTQITSSKYATTESTFDGNPTDTLGSSSDTWGHNWTVAEVSKSKFRVWVKTSTDVSNRKFRLDWVPVKVYYYVPLPPADCNKLTIGNITEVGDHIQVTVTNTTGQEGILTHLNIIWPDSDPDTNPNMNIGKIELDGNEIYPGVSYTSPLDLSGSGFTGSETLRHINSGSTELFDIFFNNAPFPLTIFNGLCLDQFTVQMDYDFPDSSSSCSLTTTGDPCPPPPTPTPTPTAGPADCGTSYVTFDPSYQHNSDLACLSVGKDQHPFFNKTSDGSYYISWLPERLKNALWIRTNTADYSKTDATWLKFKLTKDAIVHVAYYHTSPSPFSAITPIPPPTWLSNDFSYDYMRIGLNYSHICYWDTWGKNVTAGSWVSLGGNRASPSGSAPNMYMVIIEFPEGGVLSGTPTPTPDRPTEISGIPAFFLAPPPPQVTILFDNSGSMRSQLSGQHDQYTRNRISVGRDVLATLVEGLSGVKLGVASYDGKYCSGGGSNPYPANANCPVPIAPFNSQNPVGLEPRHPGNPDNYPCGANSCSGSMSYRPVSAQILVPPLDLNVMNKQIIMYGSGFGVSGSSWVNGTNWQPLPALANKYLKQSGFFTLQLDQNCNYVNMQGIEGIFENVAHSDSGWTPIAGSLWGMRDYYQRYHLPCELDPFFTPHDYDGDGINDPCPYPTFSGGARCTNRYVILITDGEETCDSSHRAVDAVNDLRTIKVDFDGDGVWDKNTDGTDTTFDVKTFVIGLGLNQSTFFNNMASAGGTGYSAFTPTNADELAHDLSTAINSVIEGRFSGSAVAIESNSQSSVDYLFRATFYPKNWHGDLEAFPLMEDGSLDTNYYPDNPLWRTGSWLAMNWQARDVYTNSGSTLVNFTSSSLVNSYLSPTEIDYIMGDPSNEVRSGGDYRDREDGPLGDIIHSSPTLIGAPPFSYSDATYQTFAEAHKDRTPVIYFGSNDGFFNAVDPSNGHVFWSYAPTEVIPRLVDLTHTYYEHEYYVDGRPVAADVNFSSGWKTLICFGLRGGGKAYDILDITEGPPTAPDFYWSYSDASLLGYTVARPSIMKMGSGQWVMWVASGLENGDGHGHILALDLENKSLLKDIQLGTGEIASFALADTDLNGFADTIYVGDMNGYLWKIDVSSSNTSQWKSSYKQGNNPLPLFKAVDGANNPQPITGAPEVSLSCEDLIVFFGTGKFFHTNDRGDTSPQSFYCIMDDGSNFNYDRNSSSLTTYITVTGTGDDREISDTFKMTTPATIMDFASAGERNTTQPIALHGMVYFVTAIPNWDECGSGGKSYFYGIPFYTSCADREEQPDQSEDVQINYIGSGILIEPPVENNEIGYGLTSGGDIVQVPMKGKIPALQSTSWAEIF